MVLIQLTDNTEINIKPRKNIYEEFSETKKAIIDLEKEGKKIKSFSFQRIIKTETQKKQELIKTLSLPDQMSFWCEALDRKNETQKIWLKSNDLDKIFLIYAVLLERLGE